MTATEYKATRERFPPLFAAADVRRIDTALTMT